jgi:uncharacterized protein YbbK (DUF523 family)
MQEPYKILISSCLFGLPTRYDGKSQKLSHPILEKWDKENRLIPVCPEVLGGLPTPRNPNEIQDLDGKAVLEGTSKVFNTAGNDVTSHFIKGAEEALSLSKKYKIAFAILKERSPSCGVHMIYDGTFSSKTKPGKGVTTALLLKHGIPVFQEEEIEEAFKHLRSLENLS